MRPVRRSTINTPNPAIQYVSLGFTIGVLGLDFLDFLFQKIRFTFTSVS